MWCLHGEMSEEDHCEIVRVSLVKQSNYVTVQVFSSARVLGRKIAIVYEKIPSPQVILTGFLLVTMSVVNSYE